MHNSHKLGWIQRQKEVKKILKQRSQEWKEKQSLYQLMRNAASTHNSLIGNRKRGKNPMVRVQGRGNYPTANEVMPRTAFNLYPGYVSSNDIRSYPGIGYPVPSECDPTFAANSESAFKRRYSSGVSSLGEEKLGSHHEPVIKEVVSLADTTPSNVGEENEVEPRRSKRVRKNTGMYVCVALICIILDQASSDLHEAKTLQTQSFRTAINLVCRILRALAVKNHGKKSLMKWLKYKRHELLIEVYVINLE